VRTLTSGRTPTTAVVWVTFAVVHLWIAFCGVVWIPQEVFWDLSLYRSWISEGLLSGHWPVLDEPWVYPAGALVPLLAVGALLGGDDTAFAAGWTVLVTALNLVTVAWLLRRPGGRAAATWWMAFVLALGPVAVGRLDALVPPLAILALLAVARRPRVAAVLLTVGAWVKVAPGALLLPVVAALRRPWRDAVVPALVVSALVVGTVVALGGAGHLTSFLSAQGGRGMQLEAVGASPWLLWGLFSPSVERAFDPDIITFEVYGPGVTAAVLVLDVVFVVATAVTAWLVWRRRRGGADPLPAPELLARGSLLVMLTLIVTNKVLSPQYIVWLVAPVAVALALGLPGWRRTAWSVLAVATATQVVFPWLYDDVIDGWPFATLVLVARNVALVVLWVGAARACLRPPSAVEEPGQPSRTEPAAVGA